MSVWCECKKDVNYQCVTSLRRMKLGIYGPSPRVKSIFFIEWIFRVFCQFATVECTIGVPTTYNEILAGN